MDSASKTKPGKLDQLKRVGEIRDGILVAGGILYILGYVSWSIHAWTNDLGLLPALDAQYFIAGLFPALVVVLVWLGIKFSWNYSKPPPDWINPKAKLTGWKRVLRTVLFAIIYAILIAPAILSWSTWPEKYFPNRQGLVFGVLAAFQIGISFAFLFFYNPPPAKKLPRWSERVTRFVTVYMRILLVAGIGFGALFYYLNFLYSKLPQPLGGVRPRCGYLDVRKDGISKETLKSISAAASSVPSPQPSAGPSPPEPEITRSDKLELLFSGSDYVLIRVQGQIYEIKKDVIQAIQPCDK